MQMIEEHHLHLTCTRRLLPWPLLFHNSVSLMVSVEQVSTLCRLVLWRLFSGAWGFMDVLS